VPPDNPAVHHRFATGSGTGAARPLLAGTHTHSAWCHRAARRWDDFHDGYGGHGDGGHGDARLDHGATGANPRGLRQLCPFLIAVPVAITEYWIEQRVLPHAARPCNCGGSAKISRSNSYAPIAPTTASVHRAEQ
jgi:hypothetical protein